MTLHLVGASYKMHITFSFYTFAFRSLCLLIQTQLTESSNLAEIKYV